MTQSNKSSDTRDQLRRLMSRHTATTVAKPAPVIESPKVAPRPVAPVQVKQPVVKSVALPAAKVSARLSASDLTKIDRLILDAHQRVGERITVSDVLRIGLARVTGTSPISAAEIAALRANDGRRTQQSH